METTSNGLNNSNDVEAPQKSAIPETENQMEMEPLVRKKTVTIDAVDASALDKGQKISDENFLGFISSKKYHNICPSLENGSNKKYLFTG